MGEICMNIQIKIILGVLVGTLLSGCACVGRKTDMASIQPPVRTEARAMMAVPESEVGVEQGLKSVYFNFDSNELTPMNREILRENAVWAANNADKNLRLEGHCDERGTTEYNMALGQRRATAAVNYLRNLGVASSRMTAVSYGKEYPIDFGHNEEAWAKNRRVDFKTQ
jgi:peptidoglycan-associated lipoprotein